MENPDRPHPNPDPSEPASSPTRTVAPDDPNGGDDGDDGTDDEAPEMNLVDGSMAGAPGAAIGQPGVQLGTPVGRRRRRRRRRGRGAPVYFTPDGQAYRMQTAPDGQQVQVLLTPQELQQYQARLAQQSAVPGQRPLGQAPALTGQQPVPAAQLVAVEGVLDTEAKGPNAFLRQIRRNLLPTPEDPEMPKNLVQKLRLRQGQYLTAQAQMRGNKGAIQKVETVDGAALEEISRRPHFNDLTSVDPVERLEQVTDMRRSIGSKAEVLASSSDRPTGDHLKVAEMALERARRMVESGSDVIILLDSITRLARAYNKEVDSSGRTLTGGVDSRALERPKRIFGAARATEEAGTLTIVGTALIDTGSRMDEVIFEEFKGTGNSEVTLDRLLSEKRIYPAINIPQSGTRKEEKLFTPREYEKVKKLRQMLFAAKPVEAMEALVKRLSRYTYNDEFLEEL